MKKKTRLTIEIVLAAAVIVALAYFMVPRTLHTQTTYQVKQIERSVDAICQYLHEHKDLLPTLYRYHYPSRNTRNMYGSNLFKKDEKGRFVQIIPDFQVETTGLDMDKFLRDHSICDNPVWPNHHLEFYVSQSYDKRFGQSYEPDDLIVFSVHAQIVEQADSHHDAPFHLDRAEDDTYLPVVSETLFGISNGLQSTGIIIRTSYDLGDRKTIPPFTPENTSSM